MRLRRLRSQTGRAIELQRRRFLMRGGTMAGGLITAATLSALAAPAVWAYDAPRRRRPGAYGPLQPLADNEGNVVLALPKGFEYCTFSKTGEAFGDGLTVPRNHDGMACFGGGGDTVRLIRNHEIRNAPGDFTRGVNAPARLRYDAKGAGGCMTLDFDMRRKRLLNQFVSIGGTIVNCSGGWGWRNTGWITCEESTRGPANGYDRPHGYAFFVPANANTTVAAVPLKALGRFAHEAAVADERGVVYQTEDSGNASGFYRFLPRDPGDLSAGRLQMLAISGDPAALMYTGRTVGERLPVTWVDVSDPDPKLEAGAPSCFRQGRARGGAAFNRLEGIYRAADGRSIYFVSTSGGTARGPAYDRDGYGQLWHYLPGNGTDRPEGELVLVFESRAGSVLESPDNLCVTPNGAILFCEDDAVNDNDTHPLAPGITEINRLVGLGPDGEAFTFAVNLLNDSEFAGACFSPDGKTLFVNIFGNAAANSGMTCAIWGPWERGPL